MNQVLFAIVLIFLDARKSRLEFGRLDTVPVKVVRLILQLCQQPSFPHLHPPCSLPEVVEKEGKGEGNRDTDHLQLCYIFFSFLPPAFLFFYYLWKSCPLPLYLPQPPLSWSPPAPRPLESHCRSLDQDLCTYHTSLVIRGLEPRFSAAAVVLKWDVSGQLVTHYEHWV